MEKKLRFTIRFKWLILLLIVFEIPAVSTGQNLKISDFVLFAGNENCTGCGVQFGSANNVKGGFTGSYTSIKTGANFSINGSIFSGGTVELSSNTVITGNISAANSQSVKGAVLSAGPKATVNGNIDVNGNISFGSSGKVTGTVTHPAGTFYQGPNPSGGNVTGTPNLPPLPALPAITDFPKAGTQNISSTQTITPGAYGNLTLSSNKTITLSGTGIYIFKSIKNSSNTKFVFDFQNDQSGTFKIYVYGDVDLNKVSASMKNGGDATRIYAETHGTGASCSYGKYAWNLGNACGSWLGTVWAPYAGINIGSGQSNLKGAFYSGTKINTGSSVTIYFAPFTQCSTPVANAGSDQILNCSTSTVQLDGSASTSDLQYNWTTVNNGHIASGAATISPTVDAVGTYVLTVTNPNGGCVATDTAVVTFSNCILPYYPPPEGGKIRNLIGAELNSLAENFGFVSDTTQNIFILKHDSVMIEVIALQGQYQTLLSLLQTPPYGMTDLINNGPNTLIISGKYPIKNLLKLDSLPQFIDYCRPIFPSISNAGIVNSQGDTAIQSYMVREGYGLTGAGVKVGVISNSYNTIPGNPAQTDVLNGDLPGIGNPEYPEPVAGIKGISFWAGKR